LPAIHSDTANSAPIMIIDAAEADASRDIDMIADTAHGDLIGLVATRAHTPQRRELTSRGADPSLSFVMKTLPGPHRLRSRRVHPSIQIDYRFGCRGRCPRSRRSPAAFS